MLFFTGLSRFSSDVASTFVGSLASREHGIKRFMAMVDDAMGILESGDLRDFGQLLDEAWQIKRSLSQSVSTSEVDAAYAAARKAGALGGKLLGAGGGGFMMLFAEPDKHESVKKALSDFLHVPFHFEPSGSQIVLYDPEQDYSELDNGK
jgi:D-glycero-alpha-D-manno-heptose-7-phosphate kinase